MPVLAGLDEPPNAEELDTTVATLKRHKAAGGTEVTPGMILDGASEVREHTPADTPLEGMGQNTSC